LTIPPPARIESYVFKSPRDSIAVKFGAATQVVFVPHFAGAARALFFDVPPPLLPVGKLSFSFRPRGALVQVNPNAACPPFPLLYNFVQYTEQFCSMY